MLESWHLESVFSNEVEGQSNHGETTQTVRAVRVCVCVCMNLSRRGEESTISFSSSSPSSFHCLISEKFCVFSSIERGNFDLSLLTLEWVLLWVLLGFSAMIRIDKMVFKFISLWGKVYCNRNETVRMMFYACASRRK